MRHFVEEKTGVSTTSLIKVSPDTISISTGSPAAGEPPRCHLAPRRQTELGDIPDYIYAVQHTGSHIPGW